MRLIGLAMACAIGLSSLGTPAAGQITSDQLSVSIDPEAFAKRSTDEILDGIEGEHPGIIVLLAQRLFKQGQRAEAVEWYYIGQIRWFYLVGTLPAGSAEGWALQGAQHAIGPDINEWAGGDIDGLVAAIDRALAWDEAHENRFLPKDQNMGAWRQAREGLAGLRGLFIANKDKVREERRQAGLENRTP